MLSTLASLFLASSLLIGPERQLTPPNLEPAAFDQRDASTASDGNGWLVAWSSSPVVYNGEVIAATRVDFSGNVLDPSPIVIASEVSVGHPAVAFGGGHYLVAWGTPDSIRARVVGTDGTLSPSFQVASLGSAFAAPPLTVRAAWDGARFMIAWTQTLDTSQIPERRSAAILDPNGTVLQLLTLEEGAIGIDFALGAGPGEFVIVDTVVDFSGTPNGNGYPSSAQAFRIDDSGRITGRIALMQASAPLFGPRVAFNGHEYLFVASTNSGIVGFSLGARLGLDGTVTPVAQFYTGGDTVNTLTWTGTEYIVTLGDRERVDAMHLDPNGSSQSPLENLILRSDSYASDAAWSGSRLLVGINSGGNIYEHFLDLPRVIAFSPAHQELPDIASADGGDTLVVWLQSTSAMSAALHNGLPVAQWSTLATAFVSPVVAWGGSEYLAVWLGPLGVEGMRIARNGTPIDAQPIKIDGLVPEFGRPAVSFDGENFIVAYEIGGGCTHGATLTQAIRRVSPQGTVVDPMAIVIGGQSCGTTLSLASAPSGSLLAWNGTGGPSVAFITRGGSPAAPVRLSGMLNGILIRTVWTGTYFLVADLAASDAEWVTVSENGTPYQRGSTPLMQAASPTSSSLGSFGSEAVFAWTSGLSVFGLRLTHDGFAIGNPFVVSENDFLAASVAITGGEVAYSRRVDDPSVPWLTRVFTREVELPESPARRRAAKQ